MIVVMKWCEGDEGFVDGIYSSIEKARENTEFDPTEYHKPVYIEAEVDEPNCFDYNCGKRLFPKKAGKYKDRP